jgi:hypothetical protein
LLHGCYHPSPDRLLSWQIWFPLPPLSTALFFVNGGDMLLWHASSLPLAMAGF